MEPLDDQVIVITGGGSGIGQGTAIRCLELGARVVVGDISPEGISRTGALVDELGLRDRFASMVVDVTVEADVERLTQAAVTTFGDLHAVFNNAGADLATGDVGDMEADDWDRTVALLLRGPFLGIKHAVRAFRSLEHGGCIVNTSSIAGHMGGCSSTAYAGAKGGVLALTRAAAVELAPERIRVNSISPGLTLTPAAVLFSAEQTGRFLDTMQPWPEHGVPVDMAEAFVFLIGEGSRFITGQDLIVDGGHSIDSPIARSYRDWAGSVALD